MLNSVKTIRKTDNNLCYECEVIKASALRPINNTSPDKDRAVYENKC